MWQSWVEIKILLHILIALPCPKYSSAKLPLKVGLIIMLKLVLTLTGKLVNTYHVHTASMSPTLNKSSVLERIECGNAIEKSNGIMFDFYPALPHNYAQWANVDSLRS